MGKKRIFEIAKEYGVKSPEVIELLAKHNISKTNFSSVDDSEAAIIHAAFAKNIPCRLNRKNRNRKRQGTRKRQNRLLPRFRLKQSRKRQNVLP